MGRLLVLCFLLHGVLAEPSVQGRFGKITGKIQEVLDVEIECFLGIPYAKPPIGDLRFSLPEPFESLGDFRATEYGSGCPQPSFDANGTAAPILQEDCLFLNVLRKEGTSKEDSKAVIAIVHGGGFVGGSASDQYSDAASLAALEDVIVVSFNYRLGIFGFADMKDLAPGNLGLYDQRLALQWIQDHIAEFGGDPDRVTAMGISAGSMSLYAQIITPIDDKNLFRSAILDGGVLAGFDEDSDSSFNRVKRIAENLGCPIGSAEMVNCLREAKVEDLLPLSINTAGNSDLKFFTATTDGAFVPHNVEEYVERNSANLRKVRTIIGYAKDEGTFFVSTSFWVNDFPDPKTRDETIDFMKKVSSSYNHPLDYADEATRESIAKLYVDEYPGDPFRSVAELQADAVFKCPVHEFIRSYSRHNDEIFTYQFDRKLRSGISWAPNPEKMGAFHALPYAHFSGSALLGGGVSDPEDERYIRDALKMIADFAKGEGAPTFQGTTLPTFSNLEEVFVFDDASYVKRGFASERRCRELFSAKVRSTDSNPRSEL